MMRRLPNAHTRCPQAARRVVLAALVAAGLLLSAGCPCDGEPDTGSVDFDQVEVVPGADGNLELRVSGGLVGACDEVSLAPRQYIQQPEYWGYDLVVTRSSSPCIGSAVRFTAVAALDGNIGTRGVEVIGANRRQTIDVVIE